MPKTPSPRFIKAPDIELPHDFQLVAIRPLTNDGTMNRWSIVLAYSERKDEYATWKYDHDFAGCDSGNYFGVARSEGKALASAYQDFIVRNPYCAPDAGLYVLNSGDLATINAALNQEVYSRTEEMKSNDDSDLKDSNERCIEAVKETYRKLNGDEMVPV